MQWDFNRNGHECVLEELSSERTGSFDALRAYCKTCNKILGLVDKAAQPKYRLAFGTLREAIYKHLDTPV